MLSNILFCFAPCYYYLCFWLQGLSLDISHLCVVKTLRIFTFKFPDGLQVAQMNFISSQFDGCIECVVNGAENKNVSPLISL